MSSKWFYATLTFITALLIVASLHWGMRALVSNDNSVDDLLIVQPTLRRPIYAVLSVAALLTLYGVSYIWHVRLQKM